MAGAVHQKTRPKHEAYVKPDVGSWVFTPEADEPEYIAPISLNGDRTSEEYEGDLARKFGPWEKSAVLEQKDMQERMGKRYEGPKVATSMKGPQKNPTTGEVRTPQTWDFYEIYFDKAEVATPEQRERAFNIVRDWATVSTDPRAAGFRAAEIHDWHDDGSRPHLRVAISRVTFSKDGATNDEGVPLNRPELKEIEITKGVPRPRKEQLIDGQTGKATVFNALESSWRAAEAERLGARLAEAGFGWEGMRYNPGQNRSQTQSPTQAAPRPASQAVVEVAPPSSGAPARDAVVEVRTDPFPDMSAPDEAPAAPKADSVDLVASIEGTGQGSAAAKPAEPADRNAFILGATRTPFGSRAKANLSRREQLEQELASLNREDALLSDAVRAIEDHKAVAEELRLARIALNDAATTSTREKNRADGLEMDVAWSEAHLEDRERTLTQTLNQLSASLDERDNLQATIDALRPQAERTEKAEQEAVTAKTAATEANTKRELAEELAKTKSAALEKVEVTLKETSEKLEKATGDLTTVKVENARITATAETAALAASKEIKALGERLEARDVTIGELREANGRISGKLDEVEQRHVLEVEALKSAHAREMETANATIEALNQRLAEAPALREELDLTRKELHQNEFRMQFMVAITDKDEGILTSKIEQLDKLINQLRTEYPQIEGDPRNPEKSLAVQIAKILEPHHTSGMTLYREEGMPTDKRGMAEFGAKWAKTLLRQDGRFAEESDIGKWLGELKQGNLVVEDPRLQTLPPGRMADADAPSAPPTAVEAGAKAVEQSGPIRPVGLPQVDKGRRGGKDPERGPEH